MPEQADYDRFIDEQLHDVDEKMVQMPAHIARKAMEAYRRERGQGGGQGAGGDAPATLPPGSIDPATGAVVLEPGEADMGRVRREMSQSSPPDRPAAADPYDEMARAFERTIDDGGAQKHAFGVGLNILANAAHRGDSRVILSQGRSHPDRVQSWER